MDEPLDLRRLAEELWSRRRGLLILSLAASFLVLVFCWLQPDRYEAESKVMILGPVVVARSDTKATHELTLKTYIELAQSRDVLHRTLEGLGKRLAAQPAELESIALDVRAVPDTWVLALRARAPAAQDAALVASAAARRFVELVNALSSEAIQEKRASIQSELDAVEARLREERQRLELLLARTGQRTSAELRDELRRLRSAGAAEAVPGAEDAGQEDRAVPAAQPAGAGPAAAEPGPKAAAERQRQVAQLLEAERETFEAIDLQTWKLGELQSAHSSLMRQLSMLAEDIHRRLGQAVVVSEASAPPALAGPSAPKLALLAGVLTMLLSASLIVLLGLLRAERRKAAE